MNDISLLDDQTTEQNQENLETEKPQLDQKLQLQKVNKFPQKMILLGIAFTIIIPIAVGFNLISNQPKSVTNETANIITQTPTPSLTITEIPVTVTPSVTSSPNPTNTPTIVIANLPSQVSGVIYKDDNKNQIYDNGEKTFQGVLTLFDENGSQSVFNQNLTTTDGRFSISLSRGKYSLRPGLLSFYTPPQNASVQVDGSGKALTYNFGYLPVQSEGGIKLFVFDDKNENTTKDEGEELIHYQAAHITTMATGQLAKYAVPPDGMDIGYLKFGQYFVVLVPEDSTWANSFKITDPGHTVDITTSGATILYLGAKKLY